LAIRLEKLGLVEFPYTHIAGLYPFESFHAHAEMCVKHFERVWFLNITFELQHSKTSEREKSLYMHKRGLPQRKWIKSST
jgi:hypothetical protein